MKRLNGTEMKALFILSIVVPVGLLTTFRLTGILREQPKKERITLEPVTLTLSRPNQTTAITNKSLQNVWADGRSSALVVIGTYFIEYRESSSVPPYYGYDGFRFKTSVNASFPQGGLINTVKISFHPSDGNSIIFVSEERWNLRLNNATLTELRYFGTNRSDAYINALALNSTCSINDEIYWIFLGEHSETNELRVGVEIVHSDEISTKIIAIPIELRITPS